MPNAPLHNPPDDPPPAEQSPSSPESSLNLRIFETLQTLLTALILAFVFRAFFVEAFVIPTGSMAEGLVGVHATAVCPRCGWEFDCGPDQLRSAEAGPEDFAPPEELFCPNCLYEWSAADAPLPPLRPGDRILVVKWPYLVGGPLGPQRWDLVVFRDPADADQSFIKRLIALPGETVEIIDGDVFIDGRIVRKPPRVQNALWRIVSAQRFTPRRGLGRAPLRWMPVDEDAEQAWRGLDEREIRFEGDDPTPCSIRFAPDQPIQNWTGYGHGFRSDNVGDVRLAAELDWTGAPGWLRCELARGDYRFRGVVHADGRLRLEMTRDTQPPTWRRVAEGRSASLSGGAQRLEFGHLDYRVFLRVGETLLATAPDDYAPDLDVLRARMISTPVALTLTAAHSDLVLRDMRVERDVYYSFNPRRNRRAEAGNPMVLRDDEYFVLGDNSPFSHDSRSWDAVDPFVEAYYGRRSNSTGWPYRSGAVRSELIIGQASLVYLPGLLPLTSDGGMQMIDLGRVRFAR